VLSQSQFCSVLAPRRTFRCALWLRSAILLPCHMGSAILLPCHSPSMALLHHNIVSSRSAIPLAGALYMALLQNDIIRSRSAMSLAGARSMALLLNPLADARSYAPQFYSHATEAPLRTFRKLHGCAPQFYSHATLAPLRTFRWRSMAALRNNYATVDTAYHSAPGNPPLIPVALFHVAKVLYILLDVGDHACPYARPCMMMMIRPHTI
jgi:hypothetical protein